MSAWSAWALDINRWGHFLTPCLILIHSHMTVIHPIVVTADSLVIQPYTVFRVTQLSGARRL